MRIDNTTQIENPTITLSWSWLVPNIIVSAKYENERNSYGRTIGQFVHDNGWQWQPNEGNTQDVIENFAGLKIEDLAIYNLAYYTPAAPTYMGIEIPDKFLWVFPDNKFVLEGFEIPLTNGAVDIAYFQWQAFRDCLDNGNHDYLKRALMPLWDYVAEQVENQNFVEMLK
jgi:hypothetical protein